MSINDDILYKIDSEIGKDKKVVELQREIERLNQERNKLYENGLNYFLELKEKSQEIERLNKSLEEQRHFYLEKLQQKENIIKEVREYIESYMPNYDFDKTNLIKLLEILDKGE